MSLKEMLEFVHNYHEERKKELIGFDVDIMNHCHSKIEYLIFSANEKRKALIVIDDYLKAKKNMSYEEWSTLHWLQDRIRFYIEDNELEIRRLSGYE